jgi:hypothetical protein
VNSADSRLRLDLARLSQRCLDNPTAGSALIQRYVGSVFVIIRDTHEQAVEGGVRSAGMM